MNLLAEKVLRIGASAMFVSLAIFPGHATRIGEISYSFVSDDWGHAVVSRMPMATGWGDVPQAQDKLIRGKWNSIQNFRLFAQKRPRNHLAKLIIQNGRH